MDTGKNRTENKPYLWDRSGEPDPEVQKLESMLGKFRHDAHTPVFPAIVPEPRWTFFPRRLRLFSALATAALALAAIVVVTLLAYRAKPIRPGSRNFASLAKRSPLAQRRRQYCGPVRRWLLPAKSNHPRKSPISGPWRGLSGGPRPHPDRQQLRRRFRFPRQPGYFPQQCYRSENGPELPMQVFQAFLEIERRSDSSHG